MLKLRRHHDGKNKGDLKMDRDFEVREFNLQIFSGEDNSDNNMGSNKDKEEDNGKEKDPVVSMHQSELDAIIENRLKRLEKKYADYTTLKAQAEELEKLKAKDQTELEKVTAALEKANKKIEEFSIAQKAIERTQLIEGLLEKEGMTRTLASRVVGDSEEEIKKDISSLKELFGAQSKSSSTNRSSVGNPTPNHNSLVDMSSDEKAKFWLDKRKGETKAAGNALNLWDEK